MTNGGFVKKRPCRVCRTWYRPDTRLGDRQMTCGPECQAKWRKKKNQKAYKKERDYYRGTALREKLKNKTEATPPEMGATEVLQKSTSVGRKGKSRKPHQGAGILQLPRAEMCDVMGEKTATLVEYLMLIMLKTTRGAPWF